ncbi:MAG: hypothetical protein A2275_01030 [Bacteroidetes bacterium RIFOXYA12_FULL_35_11]|nr:MAG: hypothetical protein A2X01_20010 [Bacteroidetes bacterium GWF2_35_48]OFY77158.1 MAG: hypothetical protein A2275_01030 [Bacteroidetes bacterium RIFOXYA12_FULL_35_11]OFY93268.1 MAG: hypothetical protein A2491_16245 [Bacteroidetes bacterium RIFOXYC12_FULL_35_7]HBX50102.1 hypothetical protein [Bacteroidales bacterium]
MKKLIILFVFALFVSNEFLYAQKTLNSIGDDIIAQLFDRPTKWKPVKDFPDSTLTFFGRRPLAGGDDNIQEYDNYVESQCQNSPAYLYYALYMAFDKMTYWNKVSCTYNAKMISKFKTISGGKDIIKSRFYQANKDTSEPILSEFRFYNGEALKAAFNSIYRKPGDSFKGLSMQKIYDVSLKEYMRDLGKVITVVMSNKAEFTAKAAEYLKKAKTDKTFDGQEYSYPLTEKWFGAESYKKYSCLPMPSRIVGVMLRRQCDGSLPVLLNCYKTVIKDYDPSYLKEIQGKF